MRYFFSLALPESVLPMRICQPALAAGLVFLMGPAQRFPASVLGTAGFTITITAIAVTTDHHLAVATGAMVKTGISFHRHPGRSERDFEWIYTEESETLTLSRASAVLGIASEFDFHIVTGAMPLLFSRDLLTGFSFFCQRILDKTCGFVEIFDRGASH